MALPAASSSSSKFKVFISHAKEDKQTIAIPLREKLMNHGIKAFVDKKDIPTGVWFENVLIPAMKDADIAIVILSPEFVARSWPMKELLCFVRRAEQPVEDERKLSVIIPVFYRLNIKELYDEPRTDRLNAKGKSLYRETRFFERMDNGEPEADIPTIRVNLRKMHGFQGVENEEDASNDLTSEMENRRDALLNRICEEVLRSVTRGADDEAIGSIGPNPMKDEFLRHYYKSDDTASLVLDFEACEEEDKSSFEGNILRSILDTSKKQDVLCIRGPPGVGKTSILQGLSDLKKVTQYFGDGTYLLSLGADATQGRLITELSKAIKESGGRNQASQIAQKRNWVEALNGFRLWFSEKKCLFMVDDVWETSEISSGIIHEIMKIHRSGLQSKLLFTTRSAKIAAKIDVKMCFVLDPQNPIGIRSRAILLLYSGVKASDLNAEDENAVTKILTKCGGLPLFVKIAGTAVKALTISEPVNKCHGFRLYAQDLDLYVPGWLNTDVGLYKRLALTLNISVQLLEQRSIEWGFPLRLTIAQMYRRLSVLFKQSRVPMLTLRHLWELRSEAEARFLAREFEQVALANISVERKESTYVQFLSLHDFLREYAVTETRKHGEQTLGHRKVIQSYSRGLEREDGIPAWWSTRLEADGYIHSHLCRHLLSLGSVEAHEHHHHELIMLLVKPEWTVRSSEVVGVRELERDYALGAGLLDLTGECACKKCFERYGMQTREVADALRMISGAAQISHGFNVRSPREICFQLYGRLIFHSKRNFMIKKYLARIEGKASRQWVPWLSCHNSFLTPPGGPTKSIILLGSPVKCMIMTKNAEKVYCGLADGTVTLVNIVSGTVESKWRAYRSEVSSLAICQTKSMNVLLTGTCDVIDCLVVVITVWDLGSKTVLKSFELFAKDSDTDASLVEAYVNIAGDTPESWEVERREVDESSFEGKLLTPDGLGHLVVTTIPNDERFVATVRNGSLMLTESSSGQVLMEESPNFFTKARFLQVLPSGERIALITPSKIMHGLNMLEGVHFMEDPAMIPNGPDSEMGSSDLPPQSVYVVRNGTLIKQDQLSEEHTVRITCFSIDSDGSTIVFGSADKAVHVRDVLTRQEVCNPLRGHTSSVSQVFLHPSENSVISCSLDGTVRVWDLTKATLGGTADRHSAQVDCVVFTPDGKKAVSGSSDHTIRVWDVKSGKQDGEPLKGHSGGVTSLAITPDAQRIVSVSWDTTVRVWDLQFRKLLHTLKGHNSRVDDVALTPSGQHAVTCSLDGTVRVWEIGNHANDHYILGQYQSTRIASTSEESLDTVKILRTVLPASSVLVASDSSKVLTFSYSQEEIIVWGLETGEKLETIELTIAKAMEICHNLGPGLIGDSTIFRDEQDMWATDGLSRFVLGTMEAKISSWRFSPDKRTICVGLDDGQVAFMTLRTNGEGKLMRFVSNRIRLVKSKCTDYSSLDGFTSLIAMDGDQIASIIMFLSFSEYCYYRGITTRLNPKPEALICFGAAEP